MDLMDKDLSLNYLSHCDPRLNYEQSLGRPSLSTFSTAGKNLLSLVVRRCRFPHFGLLEGKEKGHAAKGCIVRGTREGTFEFDVTAVAFGTADETRGSICILSCIS